jgi:tRNA(Ile)-lysidine synthase
VTPGACTAEGAVALSLDEGASAIRAQLATGERRLLVAVSGGPDSMVLMHAAAHLARIAPDHDVAIACVDHGLRKASAAEARAVAQEAARLGLACRILSWQDTDKPARGIQQAAREARYRLLADEAHRTGAQVLLTAHTQDDQAETVLMRIAAGSGIDGLAGMAPRTPLGFGPLPQIMLARPFLAIPKSRLLAACAHLGLAPVQDPSNADHRFARARLRESMAVLAAEGLTVQRLVRLGARAGQVREGLDFAGKMLFHSARDATREVHRQDAGVSTEPGIRLDAHCLAGAPPVLLMRVISLALAQLSRETSRESGVSPDTGLAKQSPGQIRLARLESLANALHEALAAGHELKARTLAGARIALSDDKILHVSPAPPRRRDGS